MGTALGECLKGRVDLAVPRADLLVIHVIEGYGLGQGQEMLLAPVPMERLGNGGLIVLAAIMTEVGPWRGVALPGEDGPNDRHPGLTRQIADDMLARDVHLREGLLPMLDMLAGRGQQHGALPQRAAQYADLIRGAKGAGQQANGLEPLPPLAGVGITCGPPLDLLYRLRIDQQHLEATALQPLKEGDPIDPGRFQGDGGDTPEGQPVGRGGSVDCVRAKAAHRLRIVTRGNRHIMGFGPHVDARRMQVDGG
jgi:hypothetical protein